MSISRNHHYVPQQLSKHFTDGRWLWYFDGAKARHGINAVTPEGAFCKRDLNTFVADDGTKSDAIERFYAENLEDHTGPIFEQIVSAVRAGTDPRIEGEQRGFLQHFVFLQFKRPPDAHEEIVPDASFDSYFAKLQAKMDSDPGSFSDEDRALLADPAFRAVEMKNMRMRAVAEPSPRVFNVLSGMGLYYLVPDRSMFVIGSCPVFGLGGIEETEDLSGFTLMMPVASDVAIIFGPPQMNGAIHKIPTARWLNERIVRQSSAVGAAASPILEFFCGPGS